MEGPAYICRHTTVAVLIQNSSPASGYALHVLTNMAAGGLLDAWATHQHGCVSPLQSTHDWAPDKQQSAGRPTCHAVPSVLTAKNALTASQQSIQKHTPHPLLCRSRAPVAWPVTQDEVVVVRAGAGPAGGTEDVLHIHLPVTVQCISWDRLVRRHLRAVAHSLHTARSTQHTHMQTCQHRPWLAASIVQQAIALDHCKANASFNRNPASIDGFSTAQLPYYHSSACSLGVIKSVECGMLENSPAG
jgi:hypothetical protein